MQRIKRISLFSFCLFMTALFSCSENEVLINPIELSSGIVDLGCYPRKNKTVLTNVNGAYKISFPKKMYITPQDNKRFYDKEVDFDKAKLSVVAVNDTIYFESFFADEDVFSACFLITDSKNQKALVQVATSLIGSFGRYYDPSLKFDSDYWQNY